MPHLLARSLRAAGLAAGLAACGAPLDTAETAGDSAVDGAVDAPCDAALRVTWNSWADGFFLTWCRACHSATSADRHGAPEGVDFDSEADVLALSAAVYQAVLEAGSMPPGGGLGEDERALLEMYLDCAVD